MPPTVLMAGYTLVSKTDKILTLMAESNGMDRYHTCKPTNWCVLWLWRGLCRGCRQKNVGSHFRWGGHRWPLWVCNTEAQLGGGKGEETNWKMVVVLGAFQVEGPWGSSTLEIRGFKVKYEILSQRISFFSSPSTITIIIIITIIGWIVSPQKMFKSQLPVLRMWPLFGNRVFAESSEGEVMRVGPNSVWLLSS